MHEVTKKVSTVALAAVLLFCSVVPVPTGAAIFDRARVNHAYANPVAATAAEMALYALQACCIAGGIYIAGTTISELNINSQEIYDAFSDYYTTQNDISASELEAILAGSYSNGNIDLSALTAAGITGAIPGFASVLLNNGTAVSGSSSISGNVDVLRYGGKDFPLYSGDLKGYEWLQQQSYFTSRASNNGVLVGYSESTPNMGNVTVTYIFQRSSNTPVNLVEQDNNGDIWLSLTGYQQYRFVYKESNGACSSLNGSSSTSGSVNFKGETVDSHGTCLLYGNDYSVSDVAVPASTAVMAGISAVVDEGVTSGTYEGLNSGIVQALNPTAEQLQAGYNASILQGINDANVNLGTISTGISALDATMNGLLGVCQGIASTLSNTVVGQYCAAVTQWLGATPFGTIMGTVIDGLDDIPDAVADGAAVVAGGVAALPGALEGVIEGVLEGVFGQPLAIPGFLQDILAGVQAIPGALEGAIEGITFPEWRWPEAPEIPRVNGEPVPFALSADLIADMQTDLRDKVPFCYLIRLGESFGIMFSNFQTSRSFYFDLDVPNAGSVHFDGESFLNQLLLGSNVADVIRICVTALLCTGLLYGAYKVAREL